MNLNSKINFNIINIVRSYTLPLTENVKNKKIICLKDLLNDTIFLKNCLDDNKCFDIILLNKYLDLKNSKIKLVGSIKGYHFWTIRKIIS